MHDPFELPEQLQSLVRDEIASGERIRWSGVPEPGSGFHWFMLPGVLFAIPWTGFALFWMAGAAGLFDNAGGPLTTERMLFAAFGIPFVGIGFAMLLSPFWMRRRIRQAAAQTLYVVTDRRAVVFNGGYFGNGLSAMLVGTVRKFVGTGIQVQSFTPDRLQVIERIERADGSGDIMFGREELPQGNASQNVIFRAGFYSIPDVRSVDRLLKELAATYRPPGTQDG